MGTNIQEQLQIWHYKHTINTINNFCKFLNQFKRCAKKICSDCIMLLFHELAHNAYSHFQSSNQNGRKVKTENNLTIPNRYINDLYCTFFVLVCMCILYICVKLTILKIESNHLLGLRS
jgi:predicted metal-dependent peptidase